MPVLNASNQGFWQIVQPMAHLSFLLFSLQCIELKLTKTCWFAEFKTLHTHTAQIDNMSWDGARRAAMIY